MSTVSLRSISYDDTDNIVRWRNKQSVRRNLFSQADLLPEQHIRYYEQVVLTGKCVQFIIEINNDAEEKKDIGTVFIKNIDQTNRKGEFGIFIGEDSARGKGFAKQASEQILQYGFEELKLHRIYLSVMSDNISAINLYKGVGFTQEGLLRDDYLRSDGYVDILLMAILKEDWASRKAIKPLS